MRPRDILAMGAALLLVGCASTSSPPVEDALVKIGRISERENVSVDEARSKSNVNTSVYASVSSGGGISIGLGFLLSPFTGGGSEPQPIRYRVDLLDGDRMTVYHDDPDFVIGDCVEIRVYPDESRYPPSLHRNESAC